MPTEKGELLFTEIVPIFEQINALKLFTASLAKNKSGHLRFAMTPAFGLEVAPNAIADFSQANPDITIELETQHGEQVVKSVLDGTIDLGLVFDAPQIPGLFSRTLSTTRLICVAPCGLIKSENDFLRIQDLEDHPLITLNDKSFLGRILTQKMIDAFDGPVDSRIVAETYHIAKRLVRRGAGISIIDAITAYSGDTSRLDFWEIRPKMNINIDVITRLNEPTPQYVNAFIDLIIKCLSMVDDKSIP